MRILFVTQYGPLAASSRTRVFQYLPFLTAQGIETHVLTVLPDRAMAGAQVDATRRPWRKIAYYLWAAWRSASTGWHTVWRTRRYDILFLQKVILPWPVRRLLQLSVRVLTRSSTRIVYDFDDAIFTTEIRSGHWLARLKERRNARGVPAMLALADLAVVENEYTGEFARRVCGDVLTITGPIDTSPFEAAGMDASESGRSETDPIVLGWIGSGSTAGYLNLITAVLQRLAQRHPLRLRVIGAVIELEGVDIECLPWDLALEADHLGGCDIGLMPLPDDPWTRGKGGYKLLQYMACGLAVVAHPVGINTQIVTDGENGFLAADEAMWEQRLEQLIEDRALRQRMGVAGRQRIASTYALQAQQPRLLAALRGLQEQRR